MTDSTTRFSDRVADYVKYRPSYPPEAIDAVVRLAELAHHPLRRRQPQACIADVGAGTGISSRLFAARGFDVIAIEPNAEMRAAAASDGTFRCVSGTAEHTTLADASVDLAIAAQAFHWFRPAEARVELRRVVRAPHRVAILWNERLTDTEFLRAYEAALHAYAIDYANVDHRNIDASKLSAFYRGPIDSLTFPNVQSFDREGFIGRARSSSYVPPPGHAKYDAMMRALDEIFSKHAVTLSEAAGPRVEFRYLTSVHVGKVAP